MKYETYTLFWVPCLKRCRGSRTAPVLILVQMFWPIYTSENRRKTDSYLSEPSGTAPAENWGESIWLPVELKNTEPGRYNTEAVKWWSGLLVNGLYIGSMTRFVQVSSKLIIVVKSALCFTYMNWSVWSWETDEWIPTVALFMHTHAVVNFPGFQSVSFEVLGFSALAVNHFYWRVKVPEIDEGCASFCQTRWD